MYGNMDEDDRRQVIEDTRYYIQCKQEEIYQCFDNIEDINEEVRELRTRIQDLIFTARNNARAIVKIMEEVNGSKEDLSDLQSMPDEDMGRDR